jgi:S-adenosylmethionine-diacylglycerol 3-amino-3-carboxypropyl transferase
MAKPVLSGNTMLDSEIAAKASFEDIRYAQLWEDADVLIGALPQQPGTTLVSICSAGDSALSMLTLDPARIVVVDLSKAQISCLLFRIAAMRELEQQEFLRLIGSRQGTDRDALFDRVMRRLPQDEQAFWQVRRADVIAHGAGGVGKFERYFRMMRTRLLPLVHSRATIADVFKPMPEKAARRRFHDKHWNSWRWRLLLQLFFSRFTMGRLGRDPAFFDHVEGSVAEHVARRIVHAAVDLEPAQNPYLHWILREGHGEALPHAWRAENYPLIRERLDRLDIRHGSLEAFVSTGEKADGFNLSDIFEYMNPDMFAQVYGSIIGASHPGARLVYWNMMVPRRAPPQFADTIERLEAEEMRGKAADKAFFYSDFVVEALRG